MGTEATVVDDKGCRSYEVIYGFPETAYRIIREAFVFRQAMDPELGQNRGARRLGERFGVDLEPLRVRTLYAGDGEEDPKGIRINVISDNGTRIDADIDLVQIAKSFFLAAWDSVDRYHDLSVGSWSSEEIERWVFTSSVSQIISMIDNLHMRIALMIDSYTAESIADWQNWMEKDLPHRKRKGKKVKDSRFNPVGGVLDAYTKLLRQMWRDQLRSREDIDKIQLADEYEKLKRHWKALWKLETGSNLSRADFLRHARIEGCEDTPEDLLKKLGSVARRNGVGKAGTKISEIALEHAARRVGLMKGRGPEPETDKYSRRGGGSGYSTSHLHEFLKEGKAAKRKLGSEIVGSGVSVAILSSESLLGEFRTKSRKPPEQNANIVIVEKLESLVAEMGIRSGENISRK